MKKNQRATPASQQTSASLAKEDGQGGY